MFEEKEAIASDVEVNVEAPEVDVEAPVVEPEAPATPIATPEEE